MASGIISKSSMVLLWTNPSPSSDYGAQTLSLDLSPYQYIIIAVRSEKARDMLFNNVLTIGQETWQQRLYCFDYVIRNRYCTVTATGITFATGTHYQSYASSSATSSAGDAIPYKIYGVR